MIRRLAIFFLIFSCQFMAVPAFADAPPQSKLNSVIKKISSIKHTLSTHQRTQQQLQQSLKQTDIQIGQIAYQLNKTKQELDQTSAQLRRNRLKQIELQQQSQHATELLTQQVQSMYKMGQLPFLKLLLNQNQPGTINRYLHYGRYLNEHRLKTIHHLMQLTEALEKTENQIVDQTNRLTAIQLKQKQQQHTLLSEKQHRQQLLRQIQQTITQEQTKLQRLTADKSRLTKLVKQLEDGDYTSLHGPFHKHLEWPVDRRGVIQSFGQTITGTSLKTTGLLIKTKIGTPIHSIYDGRVIFADWLRGFGLLVIVQHNASYMSLYGHCQSLYVKPNQTIQTGEVIATVGNSGGFTADALYFEIRHRGKPVNPKRWLK